MSSDPAALYLPQLPRLILAVHAGLDALGIGHGFGGALALAYATHEPRATIDIDINICAPVDRAREVLAALPQGTVWDESDIAQIQATGQTRVLWRDPVKAESLPFPIDLFFPQHELHAVVASRLSTQAFASAVIPVLAPVDIAIFKTLFDRPKDWVDLATLVEHGNLDWSEVQRWIAQLLGEDSAQYLRLQRLLSRG